jgi:hypothetical protein
MRLRLTAILFLFPALCFGQTRLDAVASSLSISNIVFSDGTTQTTAFVSSESAITPVLVDTNVTGNWSIDLTQGGVLLYYQTGAITSQSFTVSSTNDVTASEVILLTDTNAITWNTNIIWAGGSSPTQDTNDYERFVFSLYRNKIAGGYLEDD